MRRARKPTWSFVVMRGADKTVKQFHVTKRSVFAVPTIAILAVSGCFGGLLLKSAYELRNLEEQLSRQDALLAHTVSEKDEVIDSLQQDILGLSRQAQELNSKVDELHELELRLKQFIEKYGSSIPSSSSTEQKLSTSRIPAIAKLSSSGTSNYKMKQIAAISQQTDLDLQLLNVMVDSMEQSMALTLQHAQERRMMVDAYPSGWPTKTISITSGFGYRSDPFTGRMTFHAGIDIIGMLGDPVFSAADGVVSETGFDKSLGNYIIIDHLGGLQSEYMHLKQSMAKEGDLVVRGEKIGLLGSSGRSTGPHLHFQIYQKKVAVNPLPFLANES
ncbi:murein DD-endopeptidase MepM/ murein hydrolase activator NlpD [Paenibacillus castaneae]|uniref:M23 family metallopeptidase n=1 Tax=Paenibacillus castaneae TaxID=474957 RepID=UPI000C9CD49C|nr:M23 family metallopeptidase [Paenibacillus castaneae]NIK78348.1 murein DD-endopeptidase MepM/ murein hydrolase activator NlpD [Paenibacillus castaneae]